MSRAGVLPGLRLTLGFTLLYLALVVVVPLATLFKAIAEATGHELSADYRTMTRDPREAEWLPGHLVAQVGNPPRARWGDYGAAAVDGNSIWIASEYIAHACTYTPWGGPFFAGGTGDNLLGTWAASAGAPGPRAALGNWPTYIRKFTP